MQTSIRQEEWNRQALVLYIVFIAPFFFNLTFFCTIAQYAILTYQKDARKKLECVFLTLCNALNTNQYFKVLKSIPTNISKYYTFACLVAPIAVIKAAENVLIPNKKRFFLKEGKANKS